MKLLTSILKISVLLIFLTSCSSDEETFSVEGSWKLTSWSVGIPVDYNNDGVSSVNILEEVPCDTHEVLIFNNQGVVESDNTFHSEIKIALTDEVLNSFSYSVECAEGIVGMAANYAVSGNNIMIDETMATLEGNQLVRVFKGAVKIYNANYSRVLFEKDLRLEYTKM
ncbi:hypothetical protein [Gaetbulibacter saemankumensis]|uniref:hypothetical protein n=1 Tax=Gaetbulibacter saemankumensis TaxID=311208 RepID=UPI000417BE40|nr:hypothetical protein [Gaetbulibacter saemankumensis]